MNLVIMLCNDNMLSGLPRTNCHAMITMKRFPGANEQVLLSAIPTFYEACYAAGL